MQLALSANPDYSRDCRPDRANAVRAGAAVAILGFLRARLVEQPRLRLRCSGNALRDLDPAYMNNRGLGVVGEGVFVNRLSSPNS